MKVYILQSGCYDEKSIRGVYSSEKKAMAAGQSEAWVSEIPGVWMNGLDWEKAEEITEFELDPVADSK